MGTFKITLMGMIIDIISLILVFMPTIVFELANIEPFQRGFYCDDDSIKYPYRGNTVPIWVVEVVGILVPVGTILVTEILHSYYPRGPDGCSNKYPGYRLTTACLLPMYIAITYQLVGIFLFGLAVTQAITDICKYSIGRLRPHFLDVCRPNMTLLSCDTSPGFSVYVQNVTCTRSRDYALDDSRLSFLSGHTSNAFYCAVFFAFYLQARFTWKGSKLLRHLFQAVAIYAAVFTGLSRISDYKHHWSDVLAGAFLGSLIAALVSIHVSYMFRRRHPYQSNDNANVMLAINNTDAASGTGDLGPVNT